MGHYSGDGKCFEVYGPGELRMEVDTDDVSDGDAVEATMREAVAVLNAAWAAKEPGVPA